MELVAPGLDRIAVAIDFGEPSLGAARWVAGALAPDAELVLVHALDVAAAAPPGTPPPTEDERRTARERTVRRLREIGESLGARGGVRVEVREDRPAAAVASVAEEIAADLIVVGPHGGRETTRGIGSTAERLIRMSPIPVLLVQNAPAPARAPERLLVPVDQVDLTPAVIEWADFLVRRGGGGASVTLMHLLDPRWAELAGWKGASTRADVAGDDSYPTFADYASATEEWLADLAGELSGAREVEVLIARGIPGEEILGTARRAGTDLIVMGRRGRGRVLPGVLGSTASTVLRQAPCPVLVVVDPSDSIGAEWTVEELEGAGAWRHGRVRDEP